MAKSKSTRAPARARAAKRRAKKAGKTRSAKTAKTARKVSRPKPTARRAGKGGRARKRVAKKATKAAARKPATRRAASKKVAPPAPRVAANKAAPKRTAAKPPARRAPTLDRERRTVADTERSFSPPSSLDLDRSASAARSGRAELIDRIQEHTSTSPAMTAGDVDADWEAAEAVGDEAPGGDNPTPDQDVVDDIGRALGVEYDDDEELQGGDEISERDRKRWELDPASSDDFDDRE
jgi:hypothetical protein